jgi:FMN phosphatase YigB (HAD superfamily)
MTVDAAPGTPHVRAVTFDYWNTLVRATDPTAQWRVDRWRALIVDRGLDADDAQIRAAFGVAWETHSDAWRRNEQLSGERFATLAIDALPIDVSGELRTELAHAFTTEGSANEFVLCEGAAETVHALHRAGIPLGIICDVGITPSVGLRRLLARFGLLDCFAGWSFSDEVGWYKPAREIFEHALGYLGVDSAGVAHVGDLRRTDVVGARAMGMTSVRYRGAADDVSDGPEGDIVVDHHDRLIDALGLG